MESEARQLHIFLLPLMAQGHTIPMIDIARLFAARGMKSSIISTPVNAMQFIDIIDHDRQSGLDINVQIIRFPAVEAGLPEGCENMNLVTSQEMVFSFFNALGLLQQQFEKLVQEQKPDCVVADMFFPWATDVANAHGIPRLLFHGTSNFSMIVMEIIRLYAPQEKVKSNSEVFVIPELPDKIEITKSQLPLNGEVDSKSPFFEIREKIRESEVKSFGVLVNSFYELEPGYTDYYKKNMGRRSWNIGPVSLYNRSVTNKAQRGKKASVDEQHCLNWLDSRQQDSVLYVSFGSISRFAAAQFHEIALGLETSEIPFILVVRTPENTEIQNLLPDGFEERMEGRGLIIRDWAPQVLILDHPSVGAFMTHCGWNSTLEGISAGVPLITWPMFAEQFNNEKLVTQVLKTGITAGNEVWISWIGSQDVYVKKERVKDVVHILMRDGEDAKAIRRRARKLGEKAKQAVEEGGSSYNDLSSLIRELRLYPHQI